MTLIANQVGADLMKKLSKGSGGLINIKKATLVGSMKETLKQGKLPQIEIEWDLLGKPKTPVKLQFDAKHPNLFIAQLLGVIHQVMTLNK